MTSVGTTPWFDPAQMKNVISVGSALMAAPPNRLVASATPAAAMTRDAFMAFIPDRAGPVRIRLGGPTFRIAKFFRSLIAAYENLCPICFVRQPPISLRLRILNGQTADISCTETGAQHAKPSRRT